MSDMIRVLITGGAGFIGSALVRYLVGQARATVLNLDKLTYAGNLSSLRQVEEQPGFEHRTVDICDRAAVGAAFAEFQPQCVMHLAAESHVDRSIDGPAEFIHTNILGTYTLLEAAHAYWQPLGHDAKQTFRFHHISTDEVYGSLGPKGLFTEATPYSPRSPYSASKAAADHLVMAWFHTYGLPTVLTNCSNNYGPFHFPEKLIPLVILNALERQPLPIYGRGDNVRDWLYVDDHVEALWLVVCQGTAGETYNVGGNCERTNLQVVQTICALLDDMRPHPDGSYADLITLVADRPGHDQRYAIDASKICDHLGWTPRETFESGLRKTVAWYLENDWWWRPIRERKYAGERLGAGGTVERL